MLRTVHGNWFILTVVYYFTKHVKAYPLPDQQATSIARVFLNESVALCWVFYVETTKYSAKFETTLIKTTLHDTGNRENTNDILSSSVRLAS